MSVEINHEGPLSLPNVIRQNLQTLMHGQLSFWEKDLSAFSQYERRSDGEQEPRSKVTIQRCDRRKSGVEEHAPYLME